MNKWIPVTERLPEEEKEYLVTFDEDFARDYGVSVINLAPFNTEYEGFGYETAIHDAHTLGFVDVEWFEMKVLAWMPLPEPYCSMGENYGFATKEEADLWMNSKPVGKEEI